VGIILALVIMYCLRKSGLQNSLSCDFARHAWAKIDFIPFPSVCRHAHFLASGSRFSQPPLVLFTVDNILMPKFLTSQKKADLVAFMKWLTSPRAEPE